MMNIDVFFGNSVPLYWRSVAMEPETKLAISKANLTST
jgi:hypothetical protein